MKGYRTMIVAGLIAAGGVLEAADWINLVGEDMAGWVMLGIGAAMAGLRAATSTPIGKKD